MRRNALIVALAVALAIPAQFAGAQTGPQPKLPTEKLTIVTARGSFEFQVEVADDTREQAMGLMFREKMDPRAGMLFDFGQTREISMWMRNTILPLDMVFIRPDGTVARVAERTTPYSEATISSGEPVAFVLELNAGIANIIGLKPGDRLSSPTLAD